MEGKLTLKDKLEKIEDLSSRKSEIETVLLGCKHKTLELRVNGFTSFYLAREERLNELIQEYYKRELEKVDEKLNELLK